MVCSGASCTAIGCVSQQAHHGRHVEAVEGGVKTADEFAREFGAVVHPGAAGGGGAPAPGAGARCRARPSAAAMSAWRQSKTSCRTSASRSDGDRGQQAGQRLAQRGRTTGSSGEVASAGRRPLTAATASRARLRRRSIDWCCTTVVSQAPAWPGCSARLPFQAVLHDVLGFRLAADDAAADRGQARAQLLEQGGVERRIVVSCIGSPGLY